MKEEPENIIKELEKFLSKQDQKIESQVSKSLLSQTGIFFASLAVVIVFLSLLFGGITYLLRDDLNTAKKGIESIRIEIIELKGSIDSLKSKITEQDKTPKKHTVSQKNQ